MGSVPGRSIPENAGVVVGFTVTFGCSSCRIFLQVLARFWQFLFWAGEAMYRRRCSLTIDILASEEQRNGKWFR